MTKKFIKYWTNDDIVGKQGCNKASVVLSLYIFVKNITVKDTVKDFFSGVVMIQNEICSLKNFTYS